MDLLIVMGPGKEEPSNVLGDQFRFCNASVRTWCRTASLRIHTRETQVPHVSSCESIWRHERYRRNADSIFANALICPFCTFFGPSPSPSPSPRSVVLVEASWPSGDRPERSLIVSSMPSFGFRVRCLFRTGGLPKISPVRLDPI